jgi:hypothetical protein
LDRKHGNAAADKASSVTKDTASKLMRDEKLEKGRTDNAKGEGHREKSDLKEVKKAAKFGDD